MSFFNYNNRHLDTLPLHRPYVIPVTCGGDMIATLEVVVYCLVASVTAAFIGLAVAVPARVDQMMMDILTRIVTAFAGN
jgi:hypothetical protein